MAIELPLATRSTGEERPDRQRPGWGARLLIAAVVGWFALLVVVPLVAMLREAFRPGIGPALAVLQDPDVQRSFLLSLAITAIAVTVNGIFGVGFAIVLARQRFPGRALADGMLDLPFAVSPVVAGLMLVVLYGPEGWIGRHAEAAGFRVVYALPGMALATLFVTLPFVAREVIPVLEALGVEQEEAAATLGAGRWTTFWRITLPSIRWAVGYGIALTVARSLGEFGALLVVSGNLIGRTQTATLYIHDAAESFRPEGAYVASLVLASVSVSLLLGIEHLRKRLDSEGRGGL
jgi:sulfate transport system permease protein